MSEGISSSMSMPLKALAELRRRRQGDLLMLDNMLVAHGRAPYAGARQILVGMAEPVTAEQVRI